LQREKKKKKKKNNKEVGKGECEKPGTLPNLCQGKPLLGKQRCRDFLTDCCHNGGRKQIERSKEERERTRRGLGLDAVCVRAAPKVWEKKKEEKGEINQKKRMGGRIEKGGPLPNGPCTPHVQERRKKRKKKIYCAAHKTTSQKKKFHSKEKKKANWTTIRERGKTYVEC